MLKKSSILFFSICAFQYQVKAQIGDRLFLGVQLGVNKYTGDIKDSSKSTFAIAGSLTYEWTEQFHIRGQVFLSSFKTGTEIYPSYDYSVGNYNSVKSALQEGSLLAEYEIFNLYDHKFTPYVFAGFGLVHFNPYKQYYQMNENGQQRILQDHYQPIGSDKSTYTNVSANIPYGIGLRYALSENTRLSFEWNRRYLFSDNLDHIYRGSGFPHTDYYQTFSLGIMFRLSKDGSNGGTGKGGDRKDCPPVY